MSAQAMPIAAQSSVDPVSVMSVPALRADAALEVVDTAAPVFEALPAVTHNAASETSDTANQSSFLPAHAAMVEPLPVVPFTDASTAPTVAVSDLEAAVKQRNVESTRPSPHPDARLVRSAAGRYQLEITPAYELEPVPSQVVSASDNAPVAASPVQNPRAASQQQQDSVSLSRLEQRQTFVSPAETTGYQGVPAPPTAILPPTAPVFNPSVGAQSNYELQRLATASAPSFPLVNTLETSNGALFYPLPVQVPITSGYGWRTHPLSGQQRFHAGTDLGAPYGMPVLSTFPGQVVAVGHDGGYGLRVLVLSRVGDRTLAILYAHLSGAAVSLGQQVQPGQILGQVGVSGGVTGPHLHFELRELIGSVWSAVDSAPLIAAAVSARTRSSWSLLNTGTTQVQAAASGTFLPASVVSTTSALEMRVSLVRHAVAVKLASSTPVWVMDAQQRRLGVLPGLQNMITTPAGAGIRLGDYQLPSVFLLEPTAGGVLSVGGKWYRGRVLVAALPTGLSVVNWVPLEAYLTSVVGGESYPSWGIEALKAQAVAARSYALRLRLQPADTWYDLDDTTRYQSYRGIETEYSSTSQAVAETAGQIMLDHKGQVLLAEYAATQSITDEAHGGFGMSQWGAASLAQQGYGYREILGSYYKQASLTVLAASAR
ncbi:MAG: SpoIID/LytB domain-containing protein [Stenomitos frigidus ULC029]